MHMRVFVMMKEVSCKQVQLDLLSTTNVCPSTKTAWETLALLVIYPPTSSRDTTAPCVTRTAIFRFTYHIIMTTEQFGAC